MFRPWRAASISWAMAEGLPSMSHSGRRSVGAMTELRSVVELAQPLTVNNLRRHGKHCALVDMTSVATWHCATTSTAQQPHVIARPTINELQSIFRRALFAEAGVSPSASLGLGCGSLAHRALPCISGAAGPAAGARRGERAKLRTRTRTPTRQSVGWNARAAP